MVRNQIRGAVSIKPQVHSLSSERSEEFFFRVYLGFASGAPRTDFVAENSYTPVKAVRQ